MRWSSTTHKLDTTLDTDKLKYFSLFSSSVDISCDDILYKWLAADLVHWWIYLVHGSKSYSIDILSQTYLSYQWEHTTSFRSSEYVHPSLHLHECCCKFVVLWRNCMSKIYEPTLIFKCLISKMLWPEVSWGVHGLLSPWDFLFQEADHVLHDHGNFWRLVISLSSASITCKRTWS